MDLADGQVTGTCIACAQSYATYSPSRRLRCDDCQQEHWGRRGVLDLTMIEHYDPKGQVLLWR